MPGSHLDSLVRNFRAGRIGALARAISIIEDERKGYDTLARELLGGPPAARRTGFTGPPGAGKSSLLTAATETYRSDDERVGMVAVDPTSPYSGGALLGDRIRMNDLATDPGVFIRSMATRGSLGGLAGATREALDLIDAFGFERILVETVGVGQTELEIVSAADTVVVVLVPESGDSVQAMKAGLMEIADIFVVNKADRPGADRLARDLRQALRLREEVVTRPAAGHHGVDLTSVRVRRNEATEGGDRSGLEPDAPASRRPARKSPRKDETKWRVPVLPTVAHRREGVPELLATITRHREWLESSGELRRRRELRAGSRVRDIAERELIGRLKGAGWAEELIESQVGEIAAGRVTPYDVAREITDRLLRL